MTDPCPDCGGSGMVMVERQTMECCGYGTESGECCGNAVIGYDCDWEPCGNCDGTGHLT